MEPLVSIIMPVYNASHFVREAVLSALNQTYKNIELIVIDDGSKDDSVAQIADIADSRLRIFSQMNQGANVARNRGLQESKGMYIKYMDADDVMTPEAIETQVEQMSHLSEDEEPFGDFDFIDEQGNVFFHNSINTDTFPQENQERWFLTNWDMVTTCPLHRRQNIVRVGGFDIRLKDGHEHYLHFAISMAGVKFRYYPGTVYQYRSYVSQDRISCSRMSEAPNIWDRDYMLRLELNLIEQKYGGGANELSTRICQKYFDYAVKFFKFRKKSEGKYFLLRSLETPHDKHYPKYRRSYKLACLYIVLGKLVGCLAADRCVDKLARAFGRKPVESKKLQMIVSVPKT